MDVVIVLCHPRHGSLCHAVAERCARAAERAGLQHVIHDLYQERFDPILTLEELDRGFSFDETVQRHALEVTEARLLVMIHPDWWGQPPALLKGWIDRVLRPGVAYDQVSTADESRKQVPLLGGKRALVFCPTDAATPADSLEVLWRKGVFEFCGIRDVSVSILRATRDTTHARRQVWLAEAEEAVSRAILGRPPSPTPAAPGP